MGRRPQGSTRTLNRQIRHLFTPVLTVFPRKDATSVDNEQSPVTETAPGKQDEAKRPVELISTQPPDPPSEKSLGKRKRVEIDEEAARDSINDETQHELAAGRYTETNYTRANMPAALQKCALWDRVPISSVFFFRAALTLTRSQTGISATASSLATTMAYRWTTMVRASIRTSPARTG